MSCRLLLLVILLREGCLTNAGSEPVPPPPNTKTASARQNSELGVTARQRVEKWSTMGMWLPEKDVPFFRQNFRDVQDVLRDALRSSNDEIRQRAAYVVGEAGPTALPLEPVLMERIQKEPSRLIRMYLYRAAGSVRARSEKMLAVLKERISSLAKEPELRPRPYDYTPTDERIDVAAALFVLDGSPERKHEYQDVVLRWLAPPPKDLPPQKLDDYWEHRWIAVIAVEQMTGATAAIPLLEAMLKEPGAKPWVHVHATRVLGALRTNGQK